LEIVVDIHGMTAFDAQKHIEQVIRDASEEVTAIRIIHGYRGGENLRDMVSDPNAIRSNRIKRRRYTMNRGETVLELY